MSINPNTTEGGDLSELRECFALMALEQADDRRIHEMLVTEVAAHPDRSIGETLKAVLKRFRAKK